MYQNWSQDSPEERQQKITALYYDKLKHASRGHEAVKYVRRLRKGHYDQSELQYSVIIEGLSVLEAALKYQVDFEYLFVCPADIYSPLAQRVLAQLTDKARHSFLVSPKTFTLISAKDNSNGLLAVAGIDKAKLKELKSRSPELIIILDGLETPGNIGTIIRSADAVNANGIIITNRRARLFTPLMVRSSRGACFKFPIVESSVSEASSFLLSNDYEIILADTAAPINYYHHSYSRPTALIMGSERFGISSEWYTHPHTKVSIPMYGDCDSLNVSIAATVLLYEMRLQKEKLLNRA